LNVFNCNTLSEIPEYIGKGINPARIIAKGKGSQNPLYPNDTVENRNKNRRVEIIFKSFE